MYRCRFQLKCDPIFFFCSLLFLHSYWFIFVLVRSHFWHSRYSTTIEMRSRDEQKYIVDYIRYSNVVLFASFFCLFDSCPCKRYTESWPWILNLPMCEMPHVCVCRLVCSFPICHWFVHSIAERVRKRRKHLHRTKFIIFTYCYWQFHERIKNRSFLNCLQKSLFWCFYFIFFLNFHKSE